MVKMTTYDNSQYRYCEDCETTQLFEYDREMRKYRCPECSAEVEDN